MEGYAVSFNLSTEIRTKALKTSVVIDERLNLPSTVEEVEQTARQTKAVIHYKDIDGDLLPSCLRVLKRDLSSEPCVPFNPIAYGMKNMRASRPRILDLVRSKKDTFQFYQLFVSDESGRHHLAAELNEGMWHVYIESLFKKALAPLSEDDIQKVSLLQIDDELIQRAKEVSGVDIEELKKFRGNTISGALDARSKALPKPRPSHGENSTNSR